MKFGRTAAKTQFLYREKSKLIRTSDSNEPLENAMKLALSEEKEYNENNLCFYCKYFDVENKTVNVLPNTSRNLKNRYIKRIKKSK